MIKIFHVQEFYEKVLEDVDRKVLKLKKPNYDKIYKIIKKTNFSWNQLFNENNKAYKFFKIYPLYENLQKEWLKKYAKGNKFENLNSLFLKQINFYAPDIIFFQNIKFLKTIIKYLPKKIKIFIWDGINYKDKNLVNKKFVFLTNIIDSSKWYRNKKEKVFYLNHFYNNCQKKNKRKTIKKKYFLTFVGSVSNRFHFERAIFLYELNKKIKINFFIGEFPKSYKIYLISIYMFFFKKKNIIDCFKYLFAIRLLKSKNQDIAFGDKMNKIIRQSYIVLNYHITSGSGMNMRCFEVMGNGSCLLSNGKELKKFFKEGEYVSFNHLDDCYKKINYLKNNFKLIEKISIKGKKKVIKEFSYSNFKASILKIFFNQLI